MKARESAQEPSTPHPERTGIERAVRAFLLYVLVPFWMLPGFGDYVCHRRAKIEDTSGTHEALTHVLMIASTGAGIGAGLIFEINEGVLAVMAAAAVAHEAIVLWDVGYAVKRRPPSATEQHFHSFLEVLPFTALAFVACLHPAEASNVMRWKVTPERAALRPKRIPESPTYVAAIVAAGTILLALPYLEEVVRCFKVDRTFLPRND